MTPYIIHIQRLESTPLAVIRRQARPADLSRVVPECCGLVWNAVRAQKTQAGRHVALYWDGSIQLEVGVELEAPFSDQGEVVRSATPAGVVASTTHFGPYAGLGGAHEAVRQFCSANHHRLAGPSWEIYGHWQPEWNADPSRIRTDIYYLLSAASGLSAGYEQPASPKSEPHEACLAEARSARSLRSRRAAGQSTHPFFWASFLAAGDWR